GSSTSTSLNLQIPSDGFPQGVAVDAAGNVYVTIWNYGGQGTGLKLAPGATTQEVLPFTGIQQPMGVAVDAAGNVYVADYKKNEVVKLPLGSNAQTVLSFPGLNGPNGVAVDAAGNVYV